jgi:O-antigen/teichoic acid export membrane protein
MSIVREHWIRLKTSSFIHSVGVLVGGTAFAHAISALALPILTRLYSPADFSVFAVFSGLVAIISVAACLRFDVAIPIPKQVSHACNILCIAVLCALLVALSIALVVHLFPEWIVVQLNQPGLAPYLYFIPFAVLLSGIYSACQHWFVRKKDFNAIARVRVCQTCAAAGAQIAAGWWGWLSIGLLLGPTISVGAASASLIYRLVRTDAHILRSISWARMRLLFLAYDRYPKYSVPESLCNSAGMQLPIIIIATLAAGPEAGFLFVALYVMQAPMALVGSAIGQVYLSRASDHFRAKRLGTFTAGIFGGLVKVGVGPLIFGGIVAPTLCPLIFGSEWLRAGILMSWMTPWFVMQFLSTPVSMALLVTNQQKTAFILQAFGLVLRTGIVYCVTVVSIVYASEAYALSGFVFYVVYLAVIFRVTGVKIVDIKREVQRALPFLLLWVAAGWIISRASVLFLAAVR